MSEEAKTMDHADSDPTTPAAPILTGTSLELGSDAVVRTGVEIARRLGAPLHLCHAHHLPTAFFAASAGLSAVTPDLLDSESAVRERLLDEQLMRLGLDRSNIEGSIVQAGTAHRLLHETAEELGAGLMVIGARETDRPAFLGSTVDRVLRSACYPIWVVDGDVQLPPKHVVAPVDLSPLSLESLQRGLAVLDALCDEPPEIELLFVLAPDEIEGSRQFEPDQIRRMAHEELDRFVEQLDPDGTRQLSKEVREGDVRDEIVRDTREKPVDLLVLGTHGRSGFDRFLLGSIAADVAARAHVSSLIVPPCSETTADGSADADS